MIRKKVRGERATLSYSSVLREPIRNGVLVPNFIICILIKLFNHVLKFIGNSHSFQGGKKSFVCNFVKSFFSQSRKTEMA